MKRTLIYIYCFFCLPFNVSAQGVVSIFRNDQLSKEFLIEDIDSIVFRKEEIGGNIASEIIDTQVIYSKHGNYNIPLNLIDSVSLQQPLSNLFVFNSDDIGDWDEGYVYQSTNNEDLSVACVMKQTGDEITMYVNRLNFLQNIEDGYIFVWGNDGKIKNFIHNKVYFSLTYSKDQILIQGIDTLGYEVFNYQIDQISHTSSRQKSRRVISLDKIIDNWDTISKIFTGLEMANMAGNGAWKELFYSLLKTGIDMNKYTKKLNPLIKVLEIVNQIVLYDMKLQLYSVCQVNVDNVEYKTSNTASVTSNILNTNSLSYVYNAYNANYNYVHTEYENPYTDIIVPHTIYQYYSGIVVKKNKSNVSYNDYDIRPTFNTINKTTSTSSFTLSGLEAGETYYIRPYVVADMILNNNIGDGGILYGPTHEYYFNGISLNLNQASCLYLGNNKMGISFTAEIAALKNISAWGIIVRDKNGKEIDTYYAESSSSKIEKQMIIDKGLFNSDNTAEIQLCPFYVYGYFAIPKYENPTNYSIRWSAKLKADKTSSITENSAIISGISDGFIVDNTKGIEVGFCYSKNTTQPNCDNSTFISGVLSGGISSGTIGRYFFSSKLTNLSPRSTYYYRACSRIDGQYYYSDNIESFTTEKEKEPKATTGDYSDVTTNSAVVTCSFENVPDGASCYVFLQWNENGIDKMVTYNASAGVNQRISCTNLKPSTIYYYTAAIKYNNKEFTGEERSFTTKEMPLCPDSNHPHWIDLGLPSGTQWRCCNEGASTPEAYGGYYLFGQVSNAPTLEQCEELVNCCTSEWTTLNGVNGRKFTGPNGSSIFLSAAGDVWGGDLDGELQDVGLCGGYWSSTPEDENFAFDLYFHGGFLGTGNWNIRSGVQPVRPVRR